MGQRVCQICKVPLSVSKISMIDNFERLCPLCVGKIGCRNCGLNFSRIRDFLGSAFSDALQEEDKMSLESLVHNLFGLPDRTKCFRAAVSDEEEVTDLPPFHEDSDFLFAPGYLFRDDSPLADASGEREGFELREYREQVVRELSDFLLLNETAEDHRSPFGISPDILHIEPHFNSLFSVLKWIEVGTDEQWLFPVCRVRKMSELDPLFNELGIGGIYGTEPSKYSILCKCCMKKATEIRLGQLRGWIKEKMPSQEKEQEDEKGSDTGEDGVLLSRIGEDAFGVVLSFLVFPSGVVGLRGVCQSWNDFFQKSNLGWVKCLIVPLNGQVPSICQNPYADEEFRDREYAFLDRWEEEIDEGSPETMRKKVDRDRGFLGPDAFSDEKLWSFVAGLLQAFPNFRFGGGDGFPELKRVVFADKWVNSVSDLGAVLLGSLMKPGGGLVSLGLAESCESRFGAHFLQAFVSSLESVRAVCVEKHIPDGRPFLVDFPGLEEVHIKGHATTVGDLAASFLPKWIWDSNTFRTVRILKLRSVPWTAVATLLRDCHDGLSNLQKLGIEETKALPGQDDGRVEVFSDFPSLETVELSDSKVFQITNGPMFVEHLKLSPIRSFHFHLGHENPGHEVGLPGLLYPFLRGNTQLLHFSFSRLAGDGEFDLTTVSLSQMRSLSVHGVCFSGDSIRDLQQATELRRVCLIDSGVTEDVIKLLLSLPSVRSLSIIRPLLPLDWNAILEDCGTLQLESLSVYRSSLRAIKCFVEKLPELRRLRIRGLESVSDLEEFLKVCPPKLRLVGVDVAPSNKSSVVSAGLREGPRIQLLFLPHDPEMFRRDED